MGARGLQLPLINSMKTGGNWVNIVVLLMKDRYILIVHHDLSYTFTLKTPTHVTPSLISLHKPNKGLRLKVKFSQQLTPNPTIISRLFFDVIPSF